MIMLSLCLIICQIFSGAQAESCQSEYCTFFDFKVLEAACEGNDLSNVAVAPLSVKAALISLLEGSDGQARQELLATLKLPSDVENIRKEASKVLKPFQSLASGIESEMATRLWFAEEIEVSANYTDALQNYYNSDCETVNFTNSGSSAEIINEWAREATRNNTQSIVEPDNLSQDALFVMTSVLHFKGIWKYGFYEDHHWRGCYMIPERGCQAILTMHNRFEHNYALIDSLDAEVVELPYVDDRLSMLLFRPQSTGFHSLNNLIKNLTRTPISTILASLKKTDIDLVLPMFHIEAKMDLVPVLKKMGIKNVFGKAANLTGILQDSLTRVDNVFYNVKVETQTVGEIEADEYFMFLLDDTEDTYKYIDVDRPFVFAIVDRLSGGVLFAGRIVHPDYDISDVPDYSDDDLNPFMPNPFDLSMFGDY